MRHSISLLTFAAFAIAPFLHAQEGEIDVDANLRLLEDPDMNVRIVGLRKLQYSLDPRIPDACLRLLTDEGNSTRRIAARAIGSRWHQIPKNRIPVFVTALEGESIKGHPMAIRAIGLLKRDYREDVFSQSASKRWVIYGRYSLPCLIDTTTETEELLGWNKGDGDAGEAWFYGDSHINDRAVWHGSKDVVAMEVSLNRYDSEIWIWQHGEALLPVPAESITPHLGLPEDTKRIGYQDCTISKWDDDDLHIDFECVVFTSDATLTCKAVVAWNCETKKLRKISSQLEQD